MTDAERRQRAEEIFTDTHSRYMKNWAVISSLRQFRDAALEGAAQRLTEQHAAFVKARLPPKSTSVASFHSPRRRKSRASLPMWAHLKSSPNTSCLTSLTAAENRQT